MGHDVGERGFDPEDYKVHARAGGYKAEAREANRKLAAQDVELERLRKYEKHHEFVMGQVGIEIGTQVIKVGDYLAYIKRLRKLVERGQELLESIQVVTEYDSNGNDYGTCLFCNAQDYQHRVSHRVSHKETCPLQAYLNAEIEQIEDKE